MLSPVNFHARSAVRFGDAGAKLEYQQLAGFFTGMAAREDNAANALPALRPGLQALAMFVQLRRLLEAKFLELAARATSEPPTPANPVPSWKPELQELSRLPESNMSLGADIVQSYPDQAQKLRSAYANSTLLLEQKDLQKPAGNDYQALNSIFAEQEAQTTGMNRYSKALFVGSGPQPNTVLAYARYAGKVKGIDIEESAIDATRDIAEQSGGKISFEKASGYDFNYKGFSHIGIAVMVPDKKRVLQQISRTADPGAIVIMRTVDGFRGAMYGGIDAKDLKDFDQLEKVSTLRGTDHNITHALVLRKKGSPFSINPHES